MSRHTVWAGGIAGIIAGLGMLPIFHVGMFMLPLIGSVYGLPTLLGGFIGHLVHSAILGIVFASALTRPPMLDRASGLPMIVGLGIGYGILLWIIVEGLLMPLVTGARFDMLFGLVYLPVDGLLAHLTFGLILGGSVGILRTTEGSA